MPLEQPQGVVGQHLHPLHRFQAADEVCCFAQPFLVVGQTGHKDVPHPQRDAEVGDVPRHGKNVGVVFAGELPVALGVDLLEVKDHQIGVSHQAVERGKIRRVVRAERLPGGVQRRVHALGARQREELGQEVHLPQRLAAADRDAALFAPVVAVAVYPLEQRFRRPFLAALCPCFGVVAVLAP